MRDRSPRHRQRHASQPGRSVKRPGGTSLSLSEGRDFSPGRHALRSSGRATQPPRTRTAAPGGSKLPGQPGQPERLQKLLAAAGLGSRRQCEELITAGRVEVDRRVVTELGTRVDAASEEIRVDGVPLRPAKLEYFAVNKPSGVVSTNRDPAGRPRVVDLVPLRDTRLFAIGRLDLHSEGLILVTNDGELANRLTHPRYGVAKPIASWWPAARRATCSKAATRHPPGRRFCPGRAGGNQIAPQGEHDAGDGPAGREEPRNPPHSGPRRPQGAAADAHGRRTRSAWARSPWAKSAGSRTRRSRPCATKGPWREPIDRAFNQSASLGVFLLECAVDCRRYFA